MINRFYLYILFIVLAQISQLPAAPASEITFGGDARARMIYKDDSLFGNTDLSARDSYDSRVRILAHAKANGGAYAKGRFRVDNKWGFDYGEDQDVKTWADLAYLGIPIGPVVAEAGNMRSDLTRFFQWDQAVDQFIIKWDMFAASWQASYRVLQEGQESSFEIDRLEDNDHVAYGLVAAKNFSDSLSAQANLFYGDDQRDQYETGQYIESASGFFWSIFLKTEYPDFSIETELAFQAGNIRQSRDESGFVINRENVDRGDGWGWYSEGTYAFDDLLLSLNVGVTVDGYEADNDFGWIMVGNGNTEPISVISQLGANGDWFWLAPSLSWQINERATITGHFVWVEINAINTDDEDSLLEYQRLIELSGDISYEISKHATLAWKFGWLKPKIDGYYNGSEVEEDMAFATYARMQIRF